MKSMEHLMIAPWFACWGKDNFVIESGEIKSSAFIILLHELLYRCVDRLAVERNNLNVYTVIHKKLSLLLFACLQHLEENKLCKCIRKLKIGHLDTEVDSEMNIEH